MTWRWTGLRVGLRNAYRGHPAPQVRSETFDSHRFQGDYSR